MKRPALGLVLAWLLAGCATASSGVPQMVLARVNDEPITVQDLQDSFTSSHQGHGVFLAGKGAIREFLDKEVDKRLLIQEARRVGTDRDPDVVAAREALRSRRATEAFYRSLIDEKVRVTDEAIAAAYERLGVRFDARHILVDARAEAAAARQRIEGGEDFGAVARAVSLADTAAKGGDLGIVRWGQLEPALEERLWAMKTGETSAPFETEHGWNLLQMVERVEVPRPELGRARGLIRARLAKREKDDLTRALHRQLLDRAHADAQPSVIIDAALAPAGAAADGKAVVAEGGGERIMLGEVLPLIDRAALAKAAPGQRQRGLRRLLEAELARRLARARALAEGYGDRPEIQRELRRATDAAALDKLLGTVVLAQLSVGDAEAEAYWAANPEAFTERRAVKLGAIFVETEQEADDVVAALRDGKDFRALARASRNAALAAAGGDLGWVTEGRLQPEIERVAFALAEGGVGVARIDAGYVVARAEKVRPARLKPFAEVRQQAHDLARRAQARQTIGTWVAKLRAASTIEVDDAAIDRAIAAYEKQARERAARSRPRGAVEAPAAAHGAGHPAPAEGSTPK